LEELDTVPRGFRFGVIVVFGDLGGLFLIFVQLVDCPLLLTIALLNGVSANCGEEVAPRLAGEEYAAAGVSGGTWPWPI
jgi:hypothetical protein